ncbi:perilipin-4 isoform X4 [Otolemur garnettii]|uniref:perilipin-4 isoform X4 n=1 Tax=Otolemur garnettii TaxID=30611 RepID=UPI000C7F35DF|nr:perilipin-4 isoform X4 [Otolemur garnettii]
MSAQDEGSRDHPKPKGKTLSSLLGSLPGFSSARNLVANTHSSARETQPTTNPMGAPATEAVQPQADVATNLEQTARGMEKLLQPSEKMVSGAKDLVCSTMTKSKDTISSGLANMVDTAKGMVQGGLDTTRSTLTGTKEAVSSGVTGAVGMAKGVIEGGLDTSKAVITGTKDTMTTGVMGAVNLAKGTVQTGVDTTKNVLTGTKDTVTTGLTGAVNVAKGTVQTGLDTAKTVLTGTKNTLTSGVTGAVNVAKGAVQGGLDTTKSVAMGTKDTMSTGVMGAVNLAKGTVQTGLNTSKTVLTGTKDTVCTGVTSAMSAAKGTIQTGLDASKTVLSGTKDTVSTGVIGAVNVAKGTTRTGMDTTKTVLTGTKNTICSGMSSAVNVAKEAVQGGLDTTKTMAMGTKDTVTTGITGAVNLSKGTVQTAVETTKTALTGTKDTICSGMTGTVNVAKGAVQTGMDTTKTMLTSTKDTMSTGLSGAGSVAIGAVHTGLGTLQNLLPRTQDTIWGEITSCRTTDKGKEQTILSPPKALTTGVSSPPDSLSAGLEFAQEPAATTRHLVCDEALFPQEAALVSEDVGHLAAMCGPEGILGFAALQDELEGMGEIFHPMSAAEQAQLAASEPGPKVLFADQGSYFVRLGDLTPGFRQRGFEHAMSHLQHGQFQARDALAQLEGCFTLIEKAKQTLDGELCLDQGLSTSVEDTNSQEVRLVELRPSCPLDDPSSHPSPSAFLPQEQDTGVLARVCGLAQQLHTAYSGLACGLQGLPAELQGRIGQARHSLCNLYGIVSSTGSMEELPAAQLAQSFERVRQAWQGLEELLESLQHSPPLGWLVGPFASPPARQ